MDKKEAQELLDQQITIYRDKDYILLTKLIRSPDIYVVRGPSGVEYQIEVQAFWDHPKRPNNDLRVIISIDDGGFFSALVPLTGDFILSPDGRFVGE